MNDETLTVTFLYQPIRVKVSSGVSSTYRNQIVGRLMFFITHFSSKSHMNPISDVIASHQLNYHLYADDTQLYLAFQTNHLNLAIDCVVTCVSEIRYWMERNDLKLNPDKTDILLIHSRFREDPILDHLQFRDERISISDM